MRFPLPWIRALALALLPGAAFGAVTPCENGFAGEFPCHEIDLLAHLPLGQIGGGAGTDAADIWGWTDPQTGKEYAIIGIETGTSFVDISDPENPVYVGRLASESSFRMPWRDIKVYQDHAFVVADFYFTISHGVQVFDLTRLRGVANPPVTFNEDALYNSNNFRTAHNIAVNENTGFAYGLGSNTCGGGLHMIDISSPQSPAFAGCYSGDGYTHDAQCVTYQGPDSRYTGDEICFAANEDTLTVVNVTNKSSPVLISRNSYPGRGYTHQGWLTEDHRHLLLNDELDEQNFGHNTRTRIWDVSDLQNPAIIGIHDFGTTAIDHNLHTKGNFAYEANYRAGLRIMDLTDVANGNITEVAWFDVYPANDGADFNGAWGVYPYFDSGVVVVSGIEQGLFVLRPTHVRADLAVSMTDSADPAVTDAPLEYSIIVDDPGPVGATDVVLTDTLPPDATFVSAVASQGSCSESAGTVTCNLGDIPIGGSATVTIEVNPDTAGELSNTVSVTANEPDPDTANNSATEATTVLDALADDDGDGVLNGVDCAPLDGSAWAPPGPAKTLLVARDAPDNLAWSAPDDAGTATPRYDVLRSEDLSDFGDATCVESDDTDLVATDATVPGDRFGYLVRVENACGGNLGEGSGAVPRSGPACP